MKTAKEILQEKELLFIDEEYSQGYVDATEEEVTEAMEEYAKQFKLVLRYEKEEEEEREYECTYNIYLGAILTGLINVSKECSTLYYVSLDGEYCEYDGTLKECKQKINELLGI